jgi:predicted DNA-binding protein (MmcQ/YjbR family)
MNIELFREYCLSKKASTESFPFDQDTLVFKVANKMFALISLSEPDNANLKCEPENAVFLREHYDCVKPGYHMSKTHWNNIYFDVTVNDALIYQWIDDSYDLIVNGLSNKVRQEYGLT